MNDEAGLKFSGENGGNDLVKGDNFGLNIGIEDLESEKRGGEHAGNRDAHLAEVASGQFAAGNNHWPISFANGAAATHKCIVRLDIRVGVEAYSRYVEKGFSLSAAVQGFNVAEGVGETVARNADLVRGQA